MAVDVLLGLQWGDEGKGKVVDYLTPQYKMICRFQGGPNAGHTIYVNGEKIVLHTIPSGIFHEGVKNLIGSGVVIDPITLCKEIAQINDMGVNCKDHLLIAERAQLIMPTHRLLDAASEASKGKLKIGSTLRGIGPTYMDKTGRNGIRFGDIFQNDFKEKVNQLTAKHKQLLSIYDEIPEFNLQEEMDKWYAAVDELKSFQRCNSVYTMHDTLKSGEDILAEGAQGVMLDIDFGTYPYVTSSNTISAGACVGLGLAPQHIRKVFGISKSYCTRVGSGPFPTELFDAVGERIMDIGSEYGATTGRPRRCGWLDLVQLRYACILNGVTDIILTKTDIFSSFDELKVCTSYQVDGNETMEMPLYLDQANVQPQYELIPSWGTLGSAIPPTLESYLELIENFVNTKISMVSTGPGREDIILR